MRQERIDNSQYNRKVRAAQGEIRSLLSEHGAVLQRNRYREGIYAAAMRKYGKARASTKAERKSVIEAIREYDFANLNKVELRVGSYGNAINELKYEKTINLEKDEIEGIVSSLSDEIANKPVENAYVILANGDIYHGEGDETSVRVDGVNLENAIVIHNHPLSVDDFGTFGEDDFDFLVSNPTVKMYLVCGNVRCKMSLIRVPDKSYNEMYRNNTVADSENIIGNQVL